MRKEQSAAGLNCRKPRIQTKFRRPKKITLTADERVQELELWTIKQQQQKKK